MNVIFVMTGISFFKRFSIIGNQKKITCLVQMVRVNIAFVSRWCVTMFLWPM